MSGYSWGKLTEADWLRRIIFLETVAGVPGSVAAILRHLHSLRRLRRDHGWIHTLLVRTCVVSCVVCAHARVRSVTNPSIVCVCVRP